MKRFLSVLMALCLVLSALPMGVGAWNVPEQVDNYYEITDVAELYWFAAQVNGGNTSINGKLMTDLVINENVLNADGEPSGDDFQIWAPIGYCVPGGVQRLYTGTFDGNGKTISGLYFDYDKAENLGLFGCIGPGGVVKNVTVTDSYLKGGRFVGGIAGANGGTITGCAVSAAVIAEEDGAGGVAGVSYGDVERCSSTGAVTGGNDAGGLVGINSGNLVNCFNTGTVASKDFCAGGVAGYNSGLVVNCFNTGSILEGSTQGGITGGNSGTVENSYYLKDSAPASEEGLVQTAEEFASGMVCWLLQGQQQVQIWGQKIGKDSHPLFSNDEVIVIPGSEGNDGYANVVEYLPVSGTVTSFLEDGDVTVELLCDGQVVHSTVVSAMTATYAFDSVVEGEYTLRVAKANHATREYQIVIDSENVTFDAEICPVGDVTGDGVCNIKDFQRLLRHVNKTNPLF